MLLAQERKLREDATRSPGEQECTDITLQPRVERAKESISSSVVDLWRDPIAGAGYGEQKERRRL